MAGSSAHSLTGFCRTVLPVLQRRADGRRMLRVVKDIVSSDRWNSFDRFHQTTRTLAAHYRKAGAAVEVRRIQTGGRTGSGRWIIHEAADVRSAVLDIVSPIRRRILDSRENPFHAVGWSASTPPKGFRGELTVIDSPEELDRRPARSLAGKVILTRMPNNKCWTTLAKKGAAVVVFDKPVEGLPEAVPWTRFGWGGLKAPDATVRLVGLALSESQGNQLRSLLARHGRLVVRANVDVRKYVGTHDVVCGVIKGRDDPQDEVWGIAHSAEPGACDNASGVAVCVEVARVIEGLIADGLLPRPRRSIRLVNAFECYGFFGYLEQVKRFQTPLAGLDMDVVGARPQVCDGRLSWRATIPMSAGFVDRVGHRIVRAALKLDNPGYRLVPGPFVSTADTLIGDPKYGFPCPWITTHYRRKNRPYAAYHSSADTPALLSPRGLALHAAIAAGYLYYFADASSPEVLHLARTETAWALKQIKKKKRVAQSEAAYMRQQHHLSMERLKRWMWGGDRGRIFAFLAGCEREVREAAGRAARAGKPVGRRAGRRAGRVPCRTAVLAPTPENTPPPIAERIRRSKLKAWALFWADGKRNFAEIAELISCETGKEVSVEQVSDFFEAHAELGYVKLCAPKEMITKKRLVTDLKTLGLKRGMDVIVHSSLSKIGYVKGGPDTVIDALLAVVGKQGTVMMPSFNHFAAEVFNPMTSPTTNGAIPDAFWRRRQAVRSLHPSHSVAAVGPKAEEYCRGHLEAGIWSQHSPIGRLIHAGGCILLLGVTHAASTAYHIAENAASCRCVDPFGSEDRVVGSDGTVTKVRGLAWRSGRCPVSLDRLERALDRRKLQRHGTVGNARASLVKAIDLWKVRLEQLKNACPSCKIRPRRR